MFGYESVWGFIFYAKTNANNSSLKKTAKYGVVQNFCALSLSMQTMINNCHK